MLLTQTITEPGVEPVTVDDVKVSARIDPDITELDDQITTLITSTRLTAEHECERGFMLRTERYGFSDWPAETLPAAPITELVGVEAFDGTGWTAVGDFALELEATGHFRLVFGGDVLPMLPAGGSECVRVTVKVGCPANVRAYIIAMAVHQMTTASAARPTNPPAYLAGLLDRERDWA